MSSSEPRGSRDAPVRAQGSAYSSEELIARVQRLVAIPRPPGGYPLEWHAEASHLGDLTAIAMASLRSVAKSG